MSEAAAWRVPGRVEVLGKHTDYAGGNVLVCAASQAVTAVARPLTVRDAAGCGLRARSAAFPGTVSLVPGVEPDLPAGHWGRYVATAWKRLRANFGALPPAELTFSSDLPLASGMSSSSALVVASALALADLLERQIAPFLAGLASTARVNGFETDYPGRVTDWRGFRRHDFTLEGLACVLVEPNVPADPERRWFWRARFFGAFPFVDFALLKRGWHVAHVAVDELYGSPESNRRFDVLHAFLVSLGFNRKCALAGFSRGGLDACNWAAKNPGKVSSLYLDNAVCDFKSWPGGKGRGPGDSAAWQRCLAAWGFTEAQALAFEGNPVDNLKPLADARIPLLLVCGDADEVVPPDENSAIVERRYRDLGGDIEIIHKPGAGHHPHSLVDPQPIVGFILRHR